MKAESWKIPFSGKGDVMRGKTSPFFELARVLVRLDNVVRLIINANDGRHVNGCGAIRFER